MNWSRLSSEPLPLFLLEAGQAPLLTDSLRLESFARAIAAAVRPGMRVLDAGCGTGILSLLAARAGAARVQAVERDRSLAALARDIVARNGLADRIRVECREIQEIDEPEGFDLIVSETVGHVLFDEELPALRPRLQSLRAPGGRILPRRVRLLAAPVASSVWADQSGRLRQVVGFDYRPLLDQYGHTPLFLPLGKDEVLAPPTLVYELDLAAMEDWPWQSQHRFSLPDGKAANACGLWLEMELGDGIQLSTDPRLAPTHWRQGLLALPAPVRGDWLALSFHLQGPGLADLSWTMEYPGGSWAGAAALSLLRPGKGSKKTKEDSCVVC